MTPRISDDDLERLCRHVEDLPPSDAEVLPWHDKAVLDLRDTRAENARLRGALEAVAKEPAPGSTVYCRRIARAALSTPTKKEEAR